MITKAVIPIAGVGTRLLPATKACPKELFPVAEKPVLMWILEECVASGITDVLLVISPHKKIVKKFFSSENWLKKQLKKAKKEEYLSSFYELKKNLNIHYAVQRRPKGSGDAVLLAKKFAKNEPIAVLFGDDLNVTDGMPVIGQLIDVYNQTQSVVVGCQYVEDERIVKYSACKLGKAIGEKTYEMLEIVEKPSITNIPSNLAGLARYIIVPELFDYLKAAKNRIKNEEIGLTQCIDEYAKTHRVVCHEFNSARYDTGSKLGYMQAQVAMCIRDKEIGQTAKQAIKDMLNV